MEVFLIPLVYILLICLLIGNHRFFELKGVSRAFVCILFIIKAFAGIIITFNAEKIYSGDDGYFFYEAGKTFLDYGVENPYAYLKLMFGIYDSSNSEAYHHFLNWKNLPMWNDGETMIKLCSIIHIFAFSNILVHSIIFSFLSFCGLAAIYKATIHITRSNGFSLFLLLMLFPSVVFFSSGILKETLLIAISGLFFFSLTQFGVSLRMKIYCFILFLLLWLIKPHFIFFFTPAIIAYITISKLNLRSIWMSRLVILGVFALYIVLAVVVHDKVLGRNAAGTIALVQQSSMKNSIYEKAESYIQPPVIAAKYSSILRNTPEAFYQVITVPWFYTNAGLRWKAAAIENIFVLIMVLMNIYAAFDKKNKYALYHFAFLLFLISFYSLVGFTCALEASILRFKAPILPFLIAGMYMFLLQYKDKILKNETSDN
ncbi:MAG: hypothetical protein IPJ93_10720 [Bacteroidota bacterium]|nr:MAG: hypothetical protein IPJ93_10720 [Bacteroidota bacterium]